MYYFYSSPIGYLRLTCINNYITGLHFVDKKETPVDNDLPEMLKKCIQQLDEYFIGKRQVFSLDINNEGTAFRKTVWEELMKIPYGKTATYKEIADRIHKPKAIRAVGGANHHNNISIIVPCHRVIGTNGKLVGYGGEVWRKDWLLKHEKIMSGVNGVKL